MALTNITALADKSGAKAYKLGDGRGLPVSVADFSVVIAYAVLLIFSLIAPNADAATEWKLEPDGSYIIPPGATITMLKDLTEEELKNVPEAPNPAANVDSLGSSSDSSLGLKSRDGAQKDIEALAKDPNPRNRRLNAAIAFSVYYISTLTTRKDFCQAQGVNISPLVEAFKESHKDLRQIQLNEFQKRGISEKQFDKFKPQLQSVVRRDMEWLSRKTGLTLRQECEEMARHATEIVPDMHFSKINPLMYKILVSP